jgi:hypothetical protein
MLCFVGTRFLVMVRVMYSRGELHLGEASHPGEVMHPDTMFTIHYTIHGTLTM